MEKKVTIKFYLISLVNVVAAGIMSGGIWQDFLAMVGVVVVLVINHTTLLNMVSELSKSMTLSGAESQRALRKVLLLMVLKVSLLGAVAVMIYFFNKNLTPKVLLLMIFQLIIQVVSIKNNY